MIEIKWKMLDGQVFSGKGKTRDDALDTCRRAVKEAGLSLRKVRDELVYEDGEFIEMTDKTIRLSGEEAAIAGGRGR
jgi:hypothetical protein